MHLSFDGLKLGIQADTLQEKKKNVVLSELESKLLLIVCIGLDAEKDK